MHENAHDKNATLFMPAITKKSAYSYTHQVLCGKTTKNAKYFKS